MPTDQWKFISPQEEFQEGGAAEEAAMHLDREGRLRGAAAAAPGVVHFEDEESEDPIEEARLADAEEATDLEELLEVQHYAFSPEPPEE